MSDSDDMEEGLMEVAKTWLFQEVMPSRGAAGGQFLYPEGEEMVERIREDLPGMKDLPVVLSLAREVDTSLFAHYLWKSAIVLADLLVTGRLPLAKDRHLVRKVVELGCGAALPSIVFAAMHEGEKGREERVEGERERDRPTFVVTDYNDPSIFEAVNANIERNLLPAWQKLIRVQPHNWGSDCSPVLRAARGEASVEEGKKDCAEKGKDEGDIDMIIMADTIWNSSCHGILVESCRRLLSASGVIYLLYCNHSGGDEPQLFKETARAAGFVITEAMEPQWLSDPSEAKADDEHTRKVHVLRLHRAESAARSQSIESKNT